MSAGRVVHYLKTESVFYQAVVAGVKRFEIRKNDRGYQVGDRLVLEEWNPHEKLHTGNACTRDVIYMTDFNQQAGWVVLGIGKPEAERGKRQLCA